MVIKLLLIVGFIFFEIREQNVLTFQEENSQFNPFQGFGGTTSSGTSRKKNIDQIEDADYEDITHKEK